MSGRIDYPQLNDVHFPAVDEPLPVSAASAPVVDVEWSRQQVVYAMTCGSCKEAGVGQSGAAHVVLSCGHKIHLACLAKMPGVEKAGNQLGGTKVCAHCLDIALRSGLNDDLTDPDLQPDACIKYLQRKHLEATEGRINTEAVLAAGMNDEIAYTIIGDKPARAWGDNWSPVNLLAAAKAMIKNADDDDNDDAPAAAVATAAAAAAAANNYNAAPTGDMLVKCLNEKHRSLDDVLGTFKVNLAHLYLAGIRDMAQLKAIGFDVRRHLHLDFRPVLPIYMLVANYDMSYDKDLQFAMSPSELADLKLSKKELRLLGVTVSKLLATKRCSKTTLMNFHIPPSSMMKFLGMEYVHLRILEFTSKDFDREPHWKMDKSKNQRVREMAAQLDAQHQNGTK